MLTSPSTIATSQPQTQYRPLDPINPLNLTYNNPRAIFLIIDKAFISSGNSRESIITIDNDYNYTNPFII